MDHFLLVVLWTQVSISSRFRDNGHQTQWGHDLDLSGSRDVIGHVTIGLRMGHFLLVVLWTQVSISNGFRDIPPKYHVLIDTMLNRHCAFAISRDMYLLCKI